MPGPFPGMDPYLEGEWEDVHLSLVGQIRDRLNELLPPDLVCRAERQILMLGDPDEPDRWVKPDDYVAIGRRGGGGAATAAAAVLERTETFDLETETQPFRWLEIRDRQNREVVTTVEVLSPANKNGGREAFREKQRDLVTNGVSLVEIDLIREGRWGLYPPEDGVPPEFREPYRLCCTTARDGGARTRFTRVKLREPLPAIPIPLRYDDPLVALELQPLIDHAWTAGRYGGNYDADPPPFPADDAAWIADRVREWTERHGPAGSSPLADAAAGPGDEPGPTAPPGAG